MDELEDKLSFVKVYCSSRSRADKLGLPIDYVRDLLRFLESLHKTPPKGMKFDASVVIDAILQDPFVPGVTSVLVDTLVVAIDKGILSTANSVLAKMIDALTSKGCSCAVKESALLALMRLLGSLPHALLRSYISDGFTAAASVSRNAQLTPACRSLAVAVAAEAAAVASEVSVQTPSAHDISRLVGRLVGDKSHEVRLALGDLLHVLSVFYVGSLSDEAVGNELAGSGVYSGEVRSWNDPVLSLFLKCGRDPRRAVNGVFQRALAAHISRVVERLNARRDTEGARSRRSSSAVKKTLSLSNLRRRKDSATPPARVVPLEPGEQSAAGARVAQAFLLFLLRDVKAEAGAVASFIEGVFPHATNCEALLETIFGMTADLPADSDVARRLLASLHFAGQAMTHATHIHAGLRLELLTHLVARLHTLAQIAPDMDPQRHALADPTKFAIYLSLLVLVDALTDLSGLAVQHLSALVPSAARAALDSVQALQIDDTLCGETIAAVLEVLMRLLASEDVPLSVRAEVIRQAVAFRAPYRVRCLLLQGVVHMTKSLGFTLTEGDLAVVVSQASANTGAPGDLADSEYSTGLLVSAILLTVESCGVGALSECLDRLCRAESLPDHQCGALFLVAARDANSSVEGRAVFLHVLARVADDLNTKGKLRDNDALHKPLRLLCDAGMDYLKKSRPLQTNGKSEKASIGYASCFSSICQVLDAIGAENWGQSTQGRMGGKSPVIVEWAVANSLFYFKKCLLVGESLPTSSALLPTAATGGRGRQATIVDECSLKESLVAFCSNLCRPLEYDQPRVDGMRQSLLFPRSEVSGYGHHLVAPSMASLLHASSRLLGAVLTGAFPFILKENIVLAIVPQEIVASEAGQLERLASLLALRVWAGTNVSGDENGYLISREVVARIMRLLTGVVRSGLLDVQNTAGETLGLVCAQLRNANAAYGIVQVLLEQSGTSDVITTRAVDHVLNRLPRVPLSAHVKVLVSRLSDAAHKVSVFESGCLPMHGMPLRGRDWETDTTAAFASAVSALASVAQASGPQFSRFLAIATGLLQNFVGSVSFRKREFCIRNHQRSALERNLIVCCRLQEAILVSSGPDVISKAGLADTLTRMTTVMLDCRSPEVVTRALKLLQQWVSLAPGTLDAAMLLDAVARVLRGGQSDSAAVYDGYARAKILVTDSVVAEACALIRLIMSNPLLGGLDGHSTLLARSWRRIVNVLLEGCAGVGGGVLLEASDTILEEVVVHVSRDPGLFDELLKTVTDAVTAGKRSFCRGPGMREFSAADPQGIKFSAIFGQNLAAVLTAEVDNLAHFRPGHTAGVSAALRAQGRMCRLSEGSLAPKTIDQCMAVVSPIPVGAGCPLRLLGDLLAMLRLLVVSCAYVPDPDSPATPILDTKRAVLGSVVRACGKALIKSGGDLRLLRSVAEILSVMIEPGLMTNDGQFVARCLSCLFPVMSTDFTRPVSGAVHYALVVEFLSSVLTFIGCIQSHDKYRGAVTDAIVESMFEEPSRSLGSLVLSLGAALGGKDRLGGHRDLPVVRFLGTRTVGISLSLAAALGLRPRDAASCPLLVHLVASALASRGDLDPAMVPAAVVLPAARDPCSNWRMACLATRPRTPTSLDVAGVGLLSLSVLAEEADAPLLSRLTQQATAIHIATPSTLLLCGCCAAYIALQKLGVQDEHDGIRRIIGAYVSASAPSRLASAAVLALCCAAPRIDARVHSVLKGALSLKALPVTLSAVHSGAAHLAWCAPLSLASSLRNWKLGGAEASLTASLCGGIIEGLLGTKHASIATDVSSPVKDREALFLALIHALGSAVREPWVLPSVKAILASLVPDSDPFHVYVGQSCVRLTCLVSVACVDGGLGVQALAAALDARLAGLVPLVLALLGPLMLREVPAVREASLAALSQLSAQHDELAAAIAAGPRELRQLLAPKPSKTPRRTPKPSSSGRAGRTPRRTPRKGPKAINARSLQLPGMG